MYTLQLCSYQRILFRLSGFDGPLNEIALCLLVNDVCHQQPIVESVKLALTLGIAVVGLIFIWWVSQLELFENVTNLIFVLCQLFNFERTFFGRGLFAFDGWFGPSTPHWDVRLQTRHILHQCGWNAVFVLLCCCHVIATQSLDVPAAVGSQVWARPTVTQTAIQKNECVHYPKNG